ncbi:MAG: Uma2 family endonuclease [Planctomycetes bacterium]|nr:Uma2 family endonuclease [Planctomycetota bacterium]
MPRIKNIILPATRRARGRTRVAPLRPGDHLDQKTFHARYEAMPEHIRAELIEGVVYMPSPLKSPHGEMHAHAVGWLSDYHQATPGTRLYDNVTVILGASSEVQPDAALLLLPEQGGEARTNAQGYLEGPPELIVEIAWSTEGYDLDTKKNDYERAGVPEYLVIALRHSQVFWFLARQGKFRALPPGPHGILRSQVFPGLWLDPAALLRGDMARVLEVLQQGLGSIRQR